MPGAVPRAVVPGLAEQEIVPVEVPGRKGTTLFAKARYMRPENEIRHLSPNIVVTQTNQINDMREMLCKRFNECGFVLVEPNRRNEP